MRCDFDLEDVTDGTLLPSVSPQTERVRSVTFGGMDTDADTRFARARQTWLLVPLALALVAGGLAVASLRAPAAAFEETPTPTSLVATSPETPPAPIDPRPQPRPETPRPQPSPEPEPEPQPKPAPGPQPQPRIVAGTDGSIDIVLFGDSLAYESHELFVETFAGSGVSTTTVTMGGTALCDFDDQIQEVVAGGSVEAIVVAFSGNALTQCMLDSTGQGLTGEAHTAAYAAALDWTIAIANSSGIDVFVVVAPISRDATPEAAALRTLYRDTAAEQAGVHVIETGTALSPGDAYTDTLPCMDFEDESLGCVDGEIIVRAPDGAHFCPGSGPAVRGVTDICARWSSGAYRYAHAMADPILDAVVA